jgi:hypothetical protein
LRYRKKLFVDSNKEAAMKTGMTAGKFLKVVVSRQAYLNFLYLIATFPLGVFYFVFLVSGLSLGFSLAIIWIGIPILVLVAACWWMLGRFEHSMANIMLDEELHPINIPPGEDRNLWTRFRIFIENPFTWKSLLFLLMKFPLGIVTFTIQVTLVSLTIALIGMPVFYQFFDGFATSISLGPFLHGWEVDTFTKALFCGLIGILLWPVTLHALNALAWLHAKLARVLLNSKPLGKLAASF